MSITMKVGDSEGVRSVLPPSPNVQDVIKAHKIVANDDYNALKNKPQINSTTLEGDKSAGDLNLVLASAHTGGEIPTVSKISNNGWFYAESYVDSELYGDRDASIIKIQPDRIDFANGLMTPRGAFTPTKGKVFIGEEYGGVWSTWPVIAHKSDTERIIIDQTGDDNVIQFVGASRNYITGLTAPVDNSDATNKKYVDDGLATKAATSAIPNAVSQLTNDSGYVNASGAAAAAPVQSVNGSTGDVTGLATSTELTNGLATKQNTLTFDATPTLHSTNPVTSGGVYDANQEFALSNHQDPTRTALKAAGIPFGKCDATSTSTAFTATVPGITYLYDGVCAYVTNGVVNSASGFTLNINGLGALPCYSSMAVSSRATTLFSSAMTFLFVYNSSRVEGGCWDIFYGYDSNTNTIGYQLRTNSSSLPAAAKFYRYRLLFTSADGTKWVPANTSTSTNATAKRDVIQTPIDPHGEIVYYGTTTAIEANALVTAAQIWQQNSLTLGYSFNRTDAALVMPYPSPIYLKCAPQADGSAIIDADNPYVFSLPTTADGKIYIFLGRTYSATSIELTINHPVYHFYNGAIRLWTGPV